MELCGITCNKGEKKQVMFHPFELPVELPATMICGKKEGMTSLSMESMRKTDLVVCF